MSRADRLVLRWAIGFLVVGLAATTLFADRAEADHITEPTAAITDVDLRLCRYPDCADTTLACDGTDVIDFRNLRIEVFVSAEDSPSEHWNHTVVVRFRDGVKPSGDPIWREQWAGPVRHTNIPPHGPAGGNWEASQHDQRLSEADHWQVEARAGGLESGAQLSDFCEFSVVD